MDNSFVEVDLSHHLSDRAKSIRPNPLKAMYKYWDLPGLVNLAGGFPHPSLFPFEELSAVTLRPDQYSLDPSSSNNRRPLVWLWSWLNSGKGNPTLSIPKYAKPNPGSEPIQLSKALQYSVVSGLPPFTEFIRNFTLRVYRPAYFDFQVLANAGNTDGWTKAAAILCQHGELILTEEWTYPAALNSPWPDGVRPFPVPIDGIGMIPEKLEKILREWKEEEHEGKRRPHVMYTIPIGQNPTGAIMNESRKKDIYDICVKYDVVIVEDDPYFFLQMSGYKRKSERSLRSLIPDVTGARSSKAYIDGLAPSYLKLDYQKRVIRLDTFSKIVAPGSRLGWITCNSQFAAVIAEYSNSTTGPTSGFSQALVTQLVSKHWGYDSFVRWLRGLGGQYTERRDHMVDCFFECSSVNVVQRISHLPNGAPTFEAYAKSKNLLTDTCDEKSPTSDNPLFSFTIPSSGMFIWVTVHLKHRRDWTPFPAPGSTLEYLLWNELAKGGVMVAPGYMFSTDESDVPVSAESVKVYGQVEYAHMRIAFSNASPEEAKLGVERFVKVVLKFFG